MQNAKKLKGLYLITDDTLTPATTVLAQVEESLKGGARIIQLRNKNGSNKEKLTQAKSLQELCKKYDATFVLNDEIELAYELQCDGLHIGRSDHHRFKEIRENFDGILGVSCYGDIDLAKHFEDQGADYVAFGSFFPSPTKPNSDIVPLKTLEIAKEKLKIPICSIGGINSKNVDEILRYEPDMICLISDIWINENILDHTKNYVTKL